ncbi:hypothetical protein [Sphaerisporangium sp. TRM90804]|uniref:hypothetical protein n=1 Tax=Sphaerisporangium sp. TRM90804 TaxID=3031113 RepID=UPI00244D408B|nr:hypothetical protein [Sphaerisporangium sp. TRM90804]MDH2426425.1 hypothetical protein [Sphaerisporangium sp. TRM90804]
MGDGELQIVANGAKYEVGPEELFTFGRGESCAVRLSPEDTAISRVAGVVERHGSVWFLRNPSETRPLAMVDRFGLRSVLPPLSRAAVEGRVRVLVEGAHTHELVLHAPEPAQQPSAAGTGTATTAGEGVLINDQDRLALVALFAGYLREGDRYDPNPKSYAAAAARLGWPRTTLVKRIEYLRTRLDKSGVPGMQGWNALSALAEYALTTGLITKNDLDLISS